MIEINLTDNTINKHNDFIFGENSKKSTRLYLKMQKLNNDENCKLKKDIYKFITENFKKIILGDIEELVVFKNKYSSLLDEIKNNQHLDEDEKEMMLKSISEDLSIFQEEYKYFYKSKNWNAYLYQKELKINICPYCATQFIFINNSDTGNTRGTLDHFIDKGKFPIFSVSIQNLIPSCKVCNSDFKGQKEVNLVDNYTPFEKEIVKYIKFKRELIDEKKENITPNTELQIDYVSMFLGVNEDFNIKIDYSSASHEIAKKIKGNVEIFQIEEVYNNYHKKYIQESIRRAIIYNHVYRLQLLNSFSKFFSDENELKNAIMPSVQDDKFSILSKLTRDIIYEETKKFTI